MRFIKTLTISSIICASLFGQDFMEISWRSLDADFNKEFIGAYRDTLKKYNRQLLRDAPKKDDKVLVTVAIKDNRIDLKSITGSSNDGRYKPFVEEFLEKLDESIIEKLKRRDYEWVEQNPEDLKKLKIISDVVDVLPKKNHKATRDKFWWTFRQFDHSSVGRHVMRPKFSNMALLVDRGLPDIGYASDMSNSISVGVVNEIGRYFFIAPWKNIIEPPKNQARPLDGLFGVGIAFDTYSIGGQIHYQNPEINLSNLDLFDGGDSLIFARWSSSFYTSGTYSTSEKKKFVNNSNEPGPAARTLFPQGTLRWKFGLVYKELNLGVRQDTIYTSLASSDRLQSMQFFLKAEFVTDDNDYKAYSQINAGSGHASLNLGFSRSFTGVQWLRAGLEGSYHTPFDFKNDDFEYTWEPGWHIKPFIVINL